MGNYYLLALALIAVIAINALCVKWVDKKDELEAMKRDNIPYGYAFDDFYGILGIILSVIWLIVHLMAAYIMNRAIDGCLDF